MASACMRVLGYWAYIIYVHIVKIKRYIDIPRYPSMYIRIIYV